MSKEYEQLAKDIVKNLGGKENISDAYHCQTRLRFKVLDDSKIQKDALEDLEGVTKYLKNAGVEQVVIGTHVKDVFDEVENIVDVASATSSDGVPKEEKNFIQTIIDFIAGTFQPVIPALSGAGMVKAVLALLMVFNVITPESQTYYMLNLFADGVFYFLPMLLAFTCAQKLRANPILAVSVAAMMMHPNWGLLVEAGDPVHFFGILPFSLATYTSSVIPILLVIFFQSYVEKILYKVVPKSVELVFVPMLTFLIMGTLAFSIIGPIGSILGGYLATFFTFLSTNAAWVPSLLVGGLLPVMVMFGIHNAIAPLGPIQLADLGYDSIFGPGALVSNMAQATASAVVSFRTKNKKTKQVAISGAITGYMGITEPALYGVNLPKKYPLVASMIGGAVGGLYAGLTNTHRFATGSSGLPAVLLYIGDNTLQYLWNIMIAMAIAIVITGVLTYVLSFKYEKEDASVPAIPEIKPVVLEDTIIANPIPGTILELNQVEDDAFGSEALGKGFAINPTIGEVYAPFDGKVVALFPTKHAIGLESDSGVEILIHVGLNTVELNGQYFDAKVIVDERVSKDQLLLTFDIEKIQDAGYPTQVPVVVTNTPQFSKIELLKQGTTNKGEDVLNVKV